MKELHARRSAHTFSMHYFLHDMLPPTARSRTGVTSRFAYIASRGANILARQVPATGEAAHLRRRAAALDATTIDADAHDDYQRGHGRPWQHRFQLHRHSSRVFLWSSCAISRRAFACARRVASQLLSISSPAFRHVIGWDDDVRLHDTLCAAFDYLVYQSESTRDYRSRTFSRRFAADTPHQSSAHAEFTGGHAGRRARDKPPRTSTSR